MVRYAMLLDLSKRSFFHKRVPLILHLRVEFLKKSTPVILLHVKRLCSSR